MKNLNVKLQSINYEIIPNFVYTFLISHTCNPRIINPLETSVRSNLFEDRCYHRRTDVISRVSKHSILHASYAQLDTKPKP